VHQPGPAEPNSQKKEDIPITSVVTFKHGDENGVVTVEDGVGLKFILEDGAFSMPSRGQVSNDGVGSKWYVKGGSFRFRISCDLALSGATVGQDTVASPSSAPTTFYSKPMQVEQPISSKLTVSVKLLGAKDFITGWRDVKFLSKPAPMGLYGKYSQTTDPMRNRNARAILSGASQNTVNLAMGISLVCPESKLAKSKIPAFNATEFMKEEILSNENKSWTIGPTPARQTSCLPAPDPAEAPAEEEDGVKPAWKAMKKLWRTMYGGGKVVSGSEGMLALCASSLGWDKGTPDMTAAVTAIGNGGDEPWVLNGSFPEKLVHGVEEYYPSLPRVGVV